MRGVGVVLLGLTVGVVGTAAQDMGEVSGAEAAGIKCAAELQWASEFASINYAGFETKTAGRRLEYGALVSDLSRSAASATNQQECDAVLEEWRSFFRDGHLSLGRPAARSASLSVETATDAEIRARFADWPTRPMTESAARAALALLGGDRAPIEGVWESEDGSYRVVSLRDDDGPGRFTLSILRADSVWWVPGQVKATAEEVSAGGDYAVRFYMRDHSEQSWTGVVDRNVLVMNGRSFWFRDYPALPDDIAPADALAARNSAFRARSVGSGTVLVQVPSFEDPARMDSIFEAEGDRIRSAERLVIDLRGNGGGSDYNYRAFLPLIYTDTIRITANAVLATEANIAANAALAADTTLPASIREHLARQVEAMQAVVGDWHPFPDMVHVEPTVLERPSRIDVLVDEGCASSCEQFLLAARQSRKVTIYGTATAGILDFGNVRQAVMPGGSLVLYYPTTRSKRLPQAPVDGIGILPDMPIPPGVTDPLEWVLQQG